MNYIDIFNLNSQIKGIVNVSSQSQGVKLPKQQPDMFIRTTKSQEITQGEALIKELFGEEGFEQEYEKITKSLGLVHPPKLYTDMSVLNMGKDYGGGYNFAKNIITIDPKEFQGEMGKICVIVNGKEYTMIEPKTHLPIIAPKALLAGAEKKFPNMKVVLRDATKEDLKKLFIQKVVHETIHAQQHELMARTQGIGAERVIKKKGIVYTANMPPEQKQKYNEFLENQYQNSPWVNFNDIANTISQNSEQGQFALQLSEANREYTNNVSDPRYYTNLIEKDAFERSFLYVKNTLGGY